ncbi:MAG TPA: response regulator transcription factor [Anaerolineales bacterium]|nr:response regulator transcription factor [Anaerolineales bacterium]HNH26428.1 response regulator transcription factor [Anaerolineales bacterium]
MSLVRVLLADDHTVVRAGLRNALEVLPNLEIVGEVGDGIELMNAISQSPIDLLVMDASMPDFEPISAVQQIKEKYPSIKILVVSAYNDESYVVGLLKAGASGYHLKDQPLSDLQLAAQRVLSGQRWISSNLIDRLLTRQAPTPSTNLPYLTRRQRELLRLISQGADNRNIAQALDLSIKTVENHLTALYRVLGVDSRLKALNYILRHPELLASTGQEMADSNPSVKGQEFTFLIVDDNPRYRQQLGRLIGKIYPSIKLYEADTTAEALSISKQVQPQLAFIDVVLDDEDGIQCARKLRTVSPQTRIVVISAYPDKEFRRQALSAGVDVFLDKKDLDTASVQQVLEDALR